MKVPAGVWSPSDGGHLLLLRRGGRRQRLLVLRPRVVREAARALAAAAVRAPLGGLALLLVLHAAVLEPDLHLLLRQAQVRGDLDPPESGEVHVRGELALKFQELRARERRAHPLAVLYVAAVGGACREEQDNMLSRKSTTEKALNSNQMQNWRKHRA